MKFNKAFCYNFCRFIAFDCAQKNTVIIVVYVVVKN